MTATADPTKSKTRTALPVPENLFDFQRLFPDEAACLLYLEQVRWPDGFVCEKCSEVGKPFRVATRPRTVKCRACLHESSLTSGTIMHRSKTQIHVWFWAAFLMTSQTPGVSALELQKKLGIKRYETAFQLLHKLRAAMVRPDRDTIGAEWPVEMDISFVGGVGKTGIKGKTDKVPVIVAVEIRRQEKRDQRTGKIITRGIAGRIRLRLLPNKIAASIDKFSRECIFPGAVIISDNGSEFSNLLVYGFSHKPLSMRHDRAKMDAWLPMVGTVTANLKTWLSGTFHGVQKRHLQAYLDEYTFRFNRRFYRSSSFGSLLRLSVRRAGPTYKEIYDI